MRNGYNSRPIQLIGNESFGSVPAGHSGAVLSATPSSHENPILIPLCIVDFWQACTLRAVFAG